MVRSVVIRKAFRFRAYPSVEQVSQVEGWNHALRFLWNLAHEQRLLGFNRPRGERKFYTAFDQHKELTELRAELPWLAAVPRNVCAQLLVELDKAWQRCFKKLGRTPRWKRKGVDRISLCEPHPKTWHIDGGSLHFPKLGLMKFVQHRPLEGTPKTCTLVRDVDQWFVSISCEVETSPSMSRREPAVALDRGVVLLVADSDGKKIENPRYLKRSCIRLARAQRIVCRRKKDSKNREKAKLRVAKLHRRVRRQRNHVLHQISSDYAKSHGMVIVEKLNILGMTADGGGRKVSLNRNILDAGWGRLVEMLRYKLAWSGGFLVEVFAAYSSQTCSCCGSVDSRSRVSQSEFACVGCGHVEHADLNAAKVLKSRANRSVLPVEGTSLEGTRRSRKQLRVPRRLSVENFVLSGRS
jgi:putative transposase